MTWEGLVTIYHKKYVEEIGIPDYIQAYIQSRVLKKTLEAVSFEYRRGIEERVAESEFIDKALGRLTNIVSTEIKLSETQ